MIKNLHNLQRIIHSDSQNVYRLFLLSIAFFVFIHGNAQNPLLLASPLPSGSGRSIQQIIATQNGHAFFNTVDNSNHFSSLWGLWFTDGTREGTKKITLTSPPVPGGTNPFVSTEATFLTLLGNDKIIFTGDNEAGYGELWVSDGTQPGTFVLQQFLGSSTSGWPIGNLIPFQNKVFYVAITKDNLFQLYITDGTYSGTRMVYNFGDYQNLSITRCKAIGNIVYFIVTDAKTGINQMWRSDGTTIGTALIKDLGKDNPSEFMAFNNNIYFITISSINGDYIWKSNGTTAGTAQLKQISASSQSGNRTPSYAAIENAPVLASNALYFTANDGTHGDELWKTDGTENGSGMIFDFSPGSDGSNPYGLTVLNNELYFGANSSLFPAGNELFKYNGSKFSQPIETYPGPNSGNPSFLTVQNNTILFGAQRNSEVSHFWLTDGSQGNTIEISESVSYPNNFSIFGNTAFFAANADVNGDGMPDPCIYKYSVPQKIWTGNVNGDMSAIDNWYPVGAPSQTDNVLISPGAKNNLTAPLLMCNDFINNGGTVLIQNGLILMNGDFYNEGVIDNSLPGVFGVVSNVNRAHSIGSPGIFMGQFTASSNNIITLSSDTKFNALRIEGADTIYLGDYQLTFDNYVLYPPTFITNGLGKLFLPVGSSPVTFSLINPVTITNNGTSDYFGVGVKNGVFKYRLSGDTIRTEAVNKTWDIMNRSGGPANINITLQWNAADQLPGFDRNHVYLNHFTNGAWDPGNPAPALGTGPFLVTRNNITSFSPFSVTSSQGALPVTLVSFTAQPINGAIELHWQTASEQNTSYFSVERSADGIHFLEIGKAEAAGNSAVEISYLFTDVHPQSGNNYYRLKMIDKDASFAYSKIVVVKNDNHIALFRIFPSPANNILYVKAKGIQGMVTIQVFDANGRRLKMEKAILGNGNPYLLNIQDLPKGVYHLRLQNSTIAENLKFIRQ